MYADREEEAQRQSHYDARRYSSSSRSPSPAAGDRRRRDSRSSRSRRSYSRSTSPNDQRRQPQRNPTAAERESELAAQLRRRVSNGKGTARSSRGRTASRSPSARSRSRSPRSRDDDRRRRRRGDEDEDARGSRRGSARPSLEYRMDTRTDGGDRRSERAVSRGSAARYDDDRRGGGGRASREPPRGSYYDRDPYERDQRRAAPPPRGSYYDRDPYARPRGDYRDDYRQDYGRANSPRRPHVPARRAERVKTPERVEDYELRSVFCSQLAARLGQRDLGEFFEEHLGDGTVKDVRIVTDRVTGRHKGIGYVELRDEECVARAVALSGTTLFGIPILVQLTEAARNRGEGASTAQAPIRPNIAGMSVASAPEPIKVPIIDPALLANIPAAPHFAGSNLPLHIAAGMSPAAIAAATRGSQVNAAARLYVGQLHFEITDSDLKSVFDPFGTIDNVEVHRDATTGKSKGFAFVQYHNAEDAEKAIVHMDNFELAGRPIRVGHVNARGMEGRTSSQVHEAMSGATATNISSLDDGGGGGLTASSRAALMEKLARTEQPIVVPSEQLRPTSIPQATSRAVLLKNMFSPEEETERDWDVELADEVKGECEAKYGPVEKCHVDKDSAGEIWLRFADVDSAAKAIAGLNGRYFGGRTVVAHYVSESMMNATLG